MPSTLDRLESPRRRVQPGAALGGGTRRWLTVDFDGYGSNGRPTEVIIPPDKCVLWWAGCPWKKYKRNYCHRHWVEFKALGDLAPLSMIPKAPQPPCVKCHSRQSTSRSDMCAECGRKESQRRFRQQNAESIAKRKRAWREANKEHIREYDRIWAQNNRKRKGKNASGQDSSSENATPLAA